MQNDASELCQSICADLGIETVIVTIKSKRPSSSREELQGLYEREDGEISRITIWRKTAVKHKVVAFKTFLRTILHELCHHIDYAFFKLYDSLHTEGFFKRESSLYKDLHPVELNVLKVRPTFL